MNRFSSLRFTWAVLAFMLAAHPLLAQLTRIANTTLTLPPELPTRGFTTERALNNLSFDQPLAVVSAPGETHRLFVVEKPGRIMVVHNPGSANPTTSVFLDISEAVEDSGECGLLAMAFHPDYAANGYFYVWYTLSTTTAAGEGLHDRLARFRVSAADPDVADTDSEVPLISQFDEAGNHNGGDIKFGPDGYLYLSTGDEGGGGDVFQNGQRIDKDFFSSVIRIDVDQRPGSLVPNAHPSVHAGTYLIPPDNPFVGATSFNGLPVDPANVRTEIWAIGLRNPFRMSFDSATGRLWLADVGQDAREEINLITRGGNYGWNFREGSADYAGTPPSEAVFTEPIHDYSHSDGYSVTGGIVCRGTALSQLDGAYLFADYGSGAIWSLRYDGITPVEVQQLANNVGIVGFGLNPANGDILLANINEGSIRRLVYDSTNTGTSLPATLTDTGAFSDLATLTPSPGVVSYEPNVSFWSDHANKRRWFSVPALADKIVFSPEGTWSFPTGTVWVKHFDLELTRGVPSTARRLETRFLVKTADSVYGVTYRWNPEQTEATLVPEEGKNESITIVENGASRQQIWHYPSRAECMQCHTAVGGHALSFNTAQLNRSVTHESLPANQLTILAAAGYFTAPTVPDPGTLQALAPASDSSATLEHRVRSYLASNCAQCHQPGGAGLGNWDARIQTPTANAGLIDGTLVNTNGDSANRVIAAGDSAHSIMLERISTRGSGQMPPLGTNELDTANIALLTAWINGINTITFTSHPLSQVVTAGTPVTFTTMAIGNTTPLYQWKKDGVDIDGATNSAYFISSPGMDDAGTYTVVATLGVNSATSNAATLVVNATMSAPVFTTHPESQSITAGNAVTFNSMANGTPAPTYQWRKDEVDIPGATAASFTIANAAPGDAGSYTVVATNPVSDVISDAAILAVNTTPVFTTQPANQTVSKGDSVTFTTAVSGNPAPTFQWQKDGADIGGATGSSFSIPDVEMGDQGSYAAVATNTAGSATSNAATLTVNKIAAAISLSGLTATFTGSAHAVGAVTTPSALTVNFSYDGLPTVPTNAGTYAVVGTIDDTNYYGSASGSLVIAKADAVVTLDSLSAVYDGSVHAATATTSPSSLAVAFTYDGSATVPTNVGTYSVVGTINDTNYQGSASGSLIIAKADAVVTLCTLNTTFDGSDHAATATTAPASLAVAFTYDGSATVPTNAGTYTVVGTINDANYQGSASGSLVIAKATPIITWLAPAGIQHGTALSATQLNATANVAGTFSYNPASGTILDIGPQTLDAAFTPTDAANYTGATARQTITVSPVAPSIITSPANRAVAPGNNATFTVIASGYPAPTYQWQLLPAGTHTWSNLASGGNYSGATTAMLLVNSATLAMNGDQFRCVASNAVSAVTSSAALLTVTTAAIAPSEAIISFTVE